MKDEVTLAEIFAAVRDFVGDVRRQRRTVGIALAAMLVLGMVAAFGSSAEYTAQARLVPFRKAPSPGSSPLAGLARLGLAAGPGSDVTISSDLYPEVVKTLDFRSAVAETPISFSSEDSLRTAAWFFRERYRSSVFETIAKYTLRVPARLLQLLEPAAVAVAPGVGAVGGAAQGGPRVVDPEYLELVNVVGERLQIKFGSVGGVIEISARMPDPLAAADLVRVTADRLTQTVIAYEAQKAEQQLRFSEQQYTAARQQHDAAERALASFVLGNRAPGPVAQIERSRLEREASLAFDQLATASRALEEARVARDQDAPVFMTLESPIVPARPSAPRRVRILFFSFILGGLVGTGIVFFRWMATRFAV